MGTVLVLVGKIDPIDNNFKSNVDDNFDDNDDKNGNNISNDLPLILTPNR